MKKKKTSLQLCISTIDILMKILSHIFPGGCTVPVYVFVILKRIGYSEAFRVGKPPSFSIKVVST